MLDAILATLSSLTSGILAATLFGCLIVLGVGLAEVVRGPEDGPR